jgi:hypothetical protein
MHPMTSAARLAAKFARSSPSATIDDVARDAVAFHRSATAARRDLERQKCAASHVSKLQPIADRYGADVIENGDCDGMVIGLKFRTPDHTSGFRNIFFVA